MNEVKRQFREAQEGHERINQLAIDEAKLKEDILKENEKQTKRLEDLGKKLSKLKQGGVSD